MVYKSIVILIGLTVFSVHVQCDNFTEKFMSIDNLKFRSRQNRLLSFNTLDDGDISVELDFSVPFISIPVKRSLESAKGVIANINIGAVILAGAMVFGIAVLIPALVVFAANRMNLAPRDAEEHSYAEYRREGVHNSDIWRYVAMIDDMLLDNNINTTSCMQQTICWTVKSSAEKVKSGQGSSNNKIIDGLATNEWIQSAFKGTPLFEAVENGLGDENCSGIYDKCKVSASSLVTLFNTFMPIWNK